MLPQSFLLPYRACCGALHAMSIVFAGMFGLFDVLGGEGGKKFIFIIIIIIL